VVPQTAPGRFRRVCELAYVIAQWPGQWWARDHREMWDIIRTMVHVLGEEVREKHRGQVFAEVKRLEDIVINLEQVVRSYEIKTPGLSPSRQVDEEMGVPPMPTIPVPQSSPSGRPHSILETASCLVTGFLFGAFITLCIFSSQRRTLATHLT